MAQEYEEDIINGMAQLFVFINTQITAELSSPGATLLYPTNNNNPDLIDLTAQILIYRTKIADQLHFNENHPFRNSTTTYDPVYMTKQNFDNAIQLHYERARNPGKMVRLLMCGVFKPTAFLLCSLKRLSRTVPKPRLDVNAREVIITFVMDLYKYLVTSGSFSADPRKTLERAMGNEILKQTKILIAYITMENDFEDDTT